VSGAAVFVYHDFVDEAAARMRVPAAHRPYVLTCGELATHLAALAHAPFRASRLADVVRTPDTGQFVLSFDDGHISNHRVAFPLLRERGWPGCFFVIAGEIGGADAMGWSELRELADGGMEIGSHSLTHPFMHQLSRTEIHYEFAESKRRLEDGLGRPVTLASLPRGSAPAAIGEILAELGYQAFCTSEPGLVSPTTDRFAVPRIAVKRSTSAALLQNVLSRSAITVAGLRSSFAVKQMGKRLIGVGQWRAVRSAFTQLVDRAAKS
jgi:peptidoglycan/xylan/chitin deacetylase (PgdA/CDA1 family)